MATKSPTLFHNHWGRFANAAALPNVAASLTQDAALQIGDQAWSNADTTTYQCSNATLGAAVWAAMGGGGGVVTRLLIGSGYVYTQAEVSIEETVGYFEFNANDFATKDVKFVATWLPTITGVGNAYVRLYDMGPVGGPFAPTQITAALPSTYAVQATVSGLVYNATAVLTRGAPGVGQISNASRIYAVRLYGDSVGQDTIVLGSAGFLIAA